MHIFSVRKIKNSQKSFKYSRKQTKKPIIKWLILSFMVLLTIGYGWRIYSTSALIKNKWRTNIVFHTSPIVILSISKEAEEKNIIITLPKDVYINVPYGYGNYQINAVWRLGELEGKELFSQAIADLLAVPIIGWVGNENPVKLDDSDTVTLWQSLKTQFGVNLLSRQFSSNLSWLDKAFLFWTLANIKADNTYIFPTHFSQRLFQSASLPDKSQIREVNLLALDTFLEQKFEDNRIRIDGVQVEILNTTGMTGVGQEFSRYITNIGGKVVKIDNSQIKSAACTVKLHPNLQPKPISLFLKNVMDCDLQIEDDVSGTSLTVLVGDAYAARWQKSTN